MDAETLHCDVLNHTYHHAIFVSNATKTSLLIVFLPVVSFKALFSIHYFSSYHPTQHSHLLTFSKPRCTFTQMILNFFLIPSSQLWLKYCPSSDCSVTFSPGCPQIFSLLILSKLNFYNWPQKATCQKDNSVTHYARNLGFIFDERLTLSDQISSLSIQLFSYPWTPLYSSLPWF